MGQLVLQRVLMFIVLVLVLVFVCATSEPMVHAHEPSNEYINEILATLESQGHSNTTDFCTHPYEVVCGDGKQDQLPPVNRAAHIAAFNRNVAIEAGRRFLGSEAPPNDGDLLSMIALRTDARRSEANAKEYSRIRAQVLNENLEPLYEILRGETRFIQSLMHGVLPGEPYWTRINSVRFRTMAEISNLFANYPEVRLDLQLVYILNCGPSGMEQSAYTFPGYRGVVEPFLVVCPGMIVSGTPSASSTVAPTFLATFHSLAHEMSHAIDSRTFSADYEPFARCLNETMQMPLSYLPELSADVRASQAAAQLLQSLDRQMQARNWTVTHRRLTHAKAIKNIYDVYCADKPNDSLHLSGRIRINSILGSNAQIRELMGCDRNTAPVCHF